jgi:hypothetical protein
VVCLLVPGLSFHLSGWRKLGQGILAGWLGALAVYVVCLGLPVANWAFMLLISAHTASVSQRLQPWLVQHRLHVQIGVGLALFLAVALLVYAPARQGFERYVATPLPLPTGLLVVNPRVRPASIHRGDWLAYRIAGSYADGVSIRAGFGCGPVLAVPGDRVSFDDGVFRVNGAASPRRPHMPGEGEFVLPQKQWLVWPEIDVGGHGGTEATLVEAMLSLARVNEKDLVGGPYKRWWFRKQRTS